jgi:3-oxoacyl-[acyl-carrier protein] reductase
MDLELAGLNAFVSGASRGIGLGVAQALAAEGARLALAARGADALERAAASIGAGERPVSIAADMTDDGQIRAAFQRAEAALGPLDIVVANVGSGTSVAGHDVTRQEWDRVMTLNFLGAASLASVAATRLAARGRGSLIFVSSIAGLEAVGAPAPYAAAKAALQGLVKSYARTLGLSGVRVNAVAPGNVWFDGGGWDSKLKADRANVEAMLAREVPLGRFGSPREIGDVVAFLASARASFITGATIVVDGGQTRTI